MHVSLIPPIIAAALLTTAAAPALSTHAPWFRYLDPALPAAGYVTLENAAASPAKIVAASSPACGELSLHESVSRNGVESMHPVPSVTVPAKGSFAFSPGRYHLMCIHPAMRVGETVAVTLTLADGATLHASFPVFGPAGPPSQ